MPYIEKGARIVELDDKIEELADAITKDGTLDTMDSAGRMNYAITRLVMQVIKPSNYAEHALLHGVLQDVTAEYYRRSTAPYEDTKRHENGDIPEYHSPP